MHLISFQYFRFNHFLSADPVFCIVIIYIRVAQTEEKVLLCLNLEILPSIVGKELLILLIRVDMQMLCRNFLVHFRVTALDFFKTIGVLHFRILKLFYRLIDTLLLGHFKINLLKFCILCNFLCPFRCVRGILIFMNYEISFLRLNKMFHALL